MCYAREMITKVEPGSNMTFFINQAMVALYWINSICKCYESLPFTVYQHNAKSFQV